MTFQNPLRPVAAPTSRVGGGRRYQQPGIQEPLDLSPLSRTLSSIAVDYQRRENREATLEGAAAFEGLDSNDNQKSFEALVREGKIPENASPYWRRGYYQAAGRSVTAQYYAAVNARMFEFGEVKDENGQLREPPSVEDVMAEEWAKVSGSQALTNEYGRQAALLDKGEKDAALLVQGEKVRADGERAYRNEQVTAELGNFVFGLVDDPTGFGADDLEAIQDYITQEIKLGHMADPRGTAWNILSAAVNDVADEQGAEVALEVLDDMKDLKVGPTTFGTDARIRGQIETLENKLDRQLSDEEFMEERRTGIKIARLQRQAQAETSQDLLAAVRNGDDPLKVADVFAEKWRADPSTYGEFTEQMIAEMYADAASFKQSLLSVPEDDRASVDTVRKLIAEGDYREADKQRMAAMRSGEITAATALDLELEVRRHEDVGYLMQMPEVITAEEELATAFARITADLGLDLADHQEQERLEALRLFRQSARAEAMRLHADQSVDAATEFTKWLSQEHEDFIKPFRDNIGALVTSRTEKLDDITKMQSLGRSAMQQVEELNSQGLLSEARYKELRNKASNLARRDQYTNAGAFLQAKARLRPQLLDELRKGLARRDAEAQAAFEADPNRKKGDERAPLTSPLLDTSGADVLGEPSLSVAGQRLLNQREDEFLAMFEEELTRMELANPETHTADLAPKAVQAVEARLLERGLSMREEQAMDNANRDLAEAIARRDRLMDEMGVTEMREAAGTPEEQAEVAQEVHKLWNAAPVSPEPRSPEQEARARQRSFRRGAELQQAYTDAYRKGDASISVQGNYDLPDAATTKMVTDLLARRVSRQTADYNLNVSGYYKVREFTGEESQRDRQQLLNSRLLSGVPYQEVLKGEVSFHPGGFSGASRRDLLADLGTLERLKEQGATTAADQPIGTFRRGRYVGAIDTQIRELRRRTDAVTMDISDLDLNPFVVPMFRDTASAKTFFELNSDEQGQPTGTFKKLLETFGLPTDSETAQLFVSRQMDAIDY